MAGRTWKGVGGGGLVVLVAAVAALGLSAAPGRAAAGSDVLRAARLRELMSSGPVTLTGIQLAGTLDLRRLGVVRWPFVCRECTFYGGIRARGVVFEGTFDLSGTLVRGPVDFEQARFRGQALFGTPPARPSFTTLFGGGADFKLARFDQLTTFERAIFNRGVDFTLASFAATAIFSGIEVKAPAEFARTLYAARADFLRARFDVGADFMLADFTGAADFGQALFNKRTAVFSDAHFGGDADFRGAAFVGGMGTSPYSAVFDGASSARDLDFDAATFSPEAPASFERATSAAAISFAGAILPIAPLLDMRGMTTANLFIAVPDVLRSVEPSDQRQVLGLLDTTAQARGDLGVANDALYAKRVLISRGYRLPERLLDLVFYRWIAGYLVRPFRPLAVLALLAALITMLAFPPWRGPRQEGSRLGRLRRKVGGYFHHYLDTLTLIGRVKADSNGRRLEILAYRILLVCALVGLANSNPTLRQMIDALH